MEWHSIANGVLRMENNNLDAKEKLKFEAIRDTLNEAERSRYVTFGLYKESYIHDVTFLLEYIDKLHEQIQKPIIDGNSNFDWGL